jgi:hypothetical protein
VLETYLLEHVGEAAGSVSGFGDSSQIFLYFTAQKLSKLVLYRQAKKEKCHCFAEFLSFMSLFD